MNRTLCMLAVAGAVGMSAQVRQSASGSAGAEVSRAGAMTNVDAVLKSGIDSKRAKVGDSVTAVTRSQTALPDGTVLPKGTELMGRVTGARAYTKDAGSGTVSLLFSNARMKNGTMVPVHAVVRALGSAPMSSPDMEGDASMDAMTPAGSASARGGGNVGGGGLLRGAGNAVGGVTNSVGNAAHTAVDTTADVAGSAVNDVSRTGRGAAGMVGSTVRGVVLTPSLDAGTSGTLTAQGRNVDLQSGTTLTLGLSK